MWLLLPSTLTATTGGAHWAERWGRNTWILRHNNSISLQLQKYYSTSDDEHHADIELVMNDTHLVEIQVDLDTCHLSRSGGKCNFKFADEGDWFHDHIFNKLHTVDEGYNHVLNYYCGGGDKDERQLEMVVQLTYRDETYQRHIYFDHGGKQFVQDETPTPLHHKLQPWYGEIDSSPHWRYWYMDHAWDDNTYIWELQKDLTRPKGNMVQLHIRTWGPWYAPELDILIDDCELTDDDLLGSCTFNITSEVHDFLGFMNSNHGSYVQYIDGNNAYRHLFEEDWQKMKDNKSFLHQIEKYHEGVREDDSKTPHRFLTLTFDDGEGGTARFVVSNSDKDY